MNAAFPTVLAAALRHEPGRPFVTFYDDATGERVELSVTTYANWVAKASSLLVDEHGLERGDTIGIDLPPHWLGAVFAGAAWNAGLVLTDEPAPDVAVCGPETLADRSATGVLTLACSLLPLGVRFSDPLPDDVHDVGIEIWGQPDAFIPWDPPQPDDLAVRWTGTETSQRDLWPEPPSSRRLLSTANPATPDGLTALTGPLAGHGSLVLVTHADADRLAAIATSERVSAEGSR